MIASLILIQIHTQWESRDAGFINGIWIPKAIDWRHPQFDTYCFANDTTVVIISSIQRQEADSIIFKAVGTSTVKIGFLRRVSTNRFLIADNSSGTSLSSRKQGTLVRFRPDDLTVLIGGTEYQRAFQYTQAGKEEIYRIVLGVLRRDQQSVLP